MNNGYTGVVNDPLTGALAPITRIGGGEVRVDRALAAPTAAWDKDVPSGALSFGFIDVADETVTLTKTVEIRNLDNKNRTYTVKPTFRFADDVANGAVTVSAPATVQVKPGQGKLTSFEVKLTIDGTKLRGNFMNSGSAGADPATLTTNEYDGYLVLDDGKHPIHLAWHVLPRKAARVTPTTTAIVPGSFPQVIGLSQHRRRHGAERRVRAAGGQSESARRGALARSRPRRTSARSASTRSRCPRASARPIPRSCGRLRSTPGSGRSICCR